MNPTITISLDLSRVKSGLQEVQTDLGKISEPVEVEINAEAALADFRDLAVVMEGVISTVKEVGRSINAVLDAAYIQRRSEALARIAFQESSDAIIDFAAQMQEITNYGDELLLPLMARMRMTFKLTADEVMKLTPQLINFAESNAAAGISLETAFNLFGRALIGNTALLSRYGIKLDTTRLQMEGVSYLAQQLKDDYGGVGEALVDVRAQFANAWGDIQETLGNIMQRLVDPLLKGLMKLFDAFQNLPPLLQGLVGGLAVALPAIVATSTAVIALSKAFVMLKTAINPTVGIISLIVGGLTAVAFGVAAATQKTEDYTKANSQLNAELEQMEQQNTKSVANFDNLSQRLLELKKGTDAATDSKQEMKAIVGELQKGYGSYLRNINLEKASWQEVASALSVARQQLTDYYVAQQTKAAFEGMVGRIAQLKRNIKQALEKEANIKLDIFDPNYATQAKQVIDMFYNRMPRAADRKPWINQMIGDWNEWQRLQKQMNAELPEYQTALSKAFELDPSTVASGLEPVATSAKSTVDAALTEFQKLKDELKYYFQSEIIRLWHEYQDKRKIIEENTVANSQEQIELLKKAEDWHAQELAKLTEKINSERLADETIYYEEVKFLDAGYYDWKVAQITKEVRRLDILTEKQDELLKQRLAALDADREAYERAPIDAIISKYDTWKQKMADTATIGVAAWQNILEGLQAVKAELEAFKDVPDVAKIIEDITTEIDIAQENAGKKRGSWFFSGILGYDPDDPQDQAKVSAIKDTYNTLNSSLSNITSGLLDINQQRKEEELARIEAVAEREGWSQEQLLASQANVNKQYEHEERRLKNIQKNMSIVQAVINTAEGATKALAMGPIIGPIMASLISGLGAVQIGIIKAQKFFRGGLFRGQGGPTDDANIIAVSDGEYIVNAASTQKHYHLLEQINSGTVSYAHTFSSSRDGEVANLLNKVVNKLEILNLNLVKKDMTVYVQNSSDIETVVRKGDQLRNQMAQLGYSA